MSRIQSPSIGVCLLAQLSQLALAASYFQITADEMHGVLFRNFLTFPIAGLAIVLSLVLVALAVRARESIVMPSLAVGISACSHFTFVWGQGIALTHIGYA